MDELSAARLRDYFLYCANTLKLSENTIHSSMNAIKFYFEQVLKKERMFFEIPRPKKKITLPNMLAISQVEKLFAQLENLKHKTRNADADDLLGLFSRASGQRGGSS